MLAAMSRKLAAIFARRVSKAECRCSALEINRKISIAVVASTKTQKKAMVNQSPDTRANKLLMAKARPAAQLSQGSVIALRTSKRKNARISEQTIKANCQEMPSRLKLIEETRPSPAHQAEEFKA